MDNRGRLCSSLAVPALPCVMLAQLGKFSETPEIFGL